MWDCMKERGRGYIFKHLLYVKSRPKVFNTKHVCYCILQIVCWCLSDFQSLNIKKKSKCKYFSKKTPSHIIFAFAHWNPGTWMDFYDIWLQKKLVSELALTNCAVYTDTTLYIYQIVLVFCPGLWKYQLLKIIIKHVYISLKLQDYEFGITTKWNLECSNCCTVLLTYFYFSNKDMNYD